MSVFGLEFCQWMSLLRKTAEYQWSIVCGVSWYILRSCWTGFGTECAGFLGWFQQYAQCIFLWFRSNSTCFGQFPTFGMSFPTFLIVQNFLCRAFRQHLMGLNPEEFFSRAFQNLKYKTLLDAWKFAQHMRCWGLWSKVDVWHTSMSSGGGGDHMDDHYKYFEWKSIGVQDVPVHLSLFLNQVLAGVTDACKIMQVS